MSSGTFFDPRPFELPPAYQHRAIRWREYCGAAAALATIASVCSFFLVSAVMLETFGFAYMTAGGGVFSKFHPGSVLAVVALGLRCLASPHPLKKAWRIAGSDSGCILLIAAVVFAGVYAVVISKTPFTPLFDTFLMPICLFLLLRDLDPAMLRWLALLLILILCANAFIAFYEFFRGTRLLHIDLPDNISADPTRSDAEFNWRAQFALDWRASSLLGHPLSNGLIIEAFILCLLSPGARWIPAGVRYALVGLQFASMFTFGARAAFVLTVLFGGVAIVRQALVAIARGYTLQPRHVAFALLGVAFAIGSVVILDATGIFDRMIERFSDDAGSATTRFTMFELFEPLSWSDLLLGPQPEVVATLQRIYGLEFGIESSWLGLILTYGLVVTATLLVGLAAFSLSVIRASGRGALTVLVVYFVLVSVAAAMSGKITSFGMTVALVLVFLKREDLYRQPIPTLRKGGHG